MKKNWIFGLSLFSLILLAGCTSIKNNIDTSNLWEDNLLWTTNPASTYCIENWWMLEIVPDEWWERWKCNFEDGSFCEERAFYNGECSPNRWDWNKVDYEEISEAIEWDADIENICPQEKKECWDGTYVIREWENCEFGECPWYDIQDAENAIDWILENKNIDTTNPELTEDDIHVMNEVINTFTNM